MTDRTCEVCDAPLTGRQRRFCSRLHARRVHKREAKARGAEWAQPQTLEERKQDLTCDHCGAHYRGYRSHGPEHRFVYCTPECQAEAKRLRYGDRCEAHDWIGKSSCPECQRLRDAQREAKASDPRNSIHRDPCAYCGTYEDKADPFTRIGLDHIVSEYAGGTDTWDNWTACCRRCNGQKGTLPLLGFLLWRRIYPDKQRIDAEMKTIHALRPTGVAGDQGSTT